MKPIVKRSLAGLLVWSVVSLTLSGCNEPPKSAVVSQSVVQKYTQAKTLQGLVTNDAGPVKTGVIKVMTAQGQEITRSTFTNGPHYSLEVPAGTELPIVLVYLADQAAEPSMQVAVVHAAASKFDINPLSTRIAEQAKALGGYTHKNLVRAAESTGSVPASNKTTAGFRGDPTTQYGGWH